jgi:dTDP-4-dehydrorhamnose 3,5-epimerase
MAYSVIPTELPEVLILEPKVFKDDRGFFFESFNELDFSRATGIEAKFVQDNQSFSRHGVLRGLHYQVQRPQAKLVRAVRGTVFDVAVDVRRGSPTFGKWAGAVLSDENMRQLWIPAGFAHGFLVLSDCADFLYKTTEYWFPEHERSLLWNDPAISIEWPETRELKIAPKDLAASLLSQAEVFD